MAESSISVLAKARREDVAAEPFPHIVIENALDGDLYRRLADTRPDFARIGWAGPAPSNKRFPFSAHQFQIADWADPAWKAFCAYHTSAAFFSEVMDLFGPWLPTSNPPAADWLASGGPERIGLLWRDGYEAADMLTDARLELNTPVLDRASSVRGPHLDTANRLYSCLLYLRDPADDTEGGDLGLYRYRGEPSHMEAHSMPDETVELVKTVRYAPNTLVAFPNSIHSIHGVTPRAVTGFERAYVFITAELEHNLFG